MDWCITKLTSTFLRVEGLCKESMNVPWSVCHVLPHTNTLPLRAISVVCSSQPSNVILILRAGVCELWLVGQIWWQLPALQVWFLLEHSHSLLFMCCLWLISFYNGRVEYSPKIKIFTIYGLYRKCVPTSAPQKNNLLQFVFKFSFSNKHKKHNP